MALVFGLALHEAAVEAEDVLLVVFVGHGLLDAEGDLYLATEATDHLRDRLDFTALSYVTVCKELKRSRARRRIVMLDCCFSGQAGGVPAPAVLDSLATTRFAGSYLLVSSAPEEVALAPPDQPHTAFTGELIRLLREGDPATDSSELSLDHLYRCLERTLSDWGYPRPHRSATDRAGDLILAPNPAYQAPPLPRPPPVRTDGTGPYRGLNRFDVTDADYFFGRETLTTELTAQLAKQLPGTGMLVVIGPSGSGKSSLLRAGLIPALEKAGLPDVPGSQTWPKIVLTPGPHPLGTLARQLAPLIGDQAGTLRTRLADRPAELNQIASAVLACHGVPGTGEGRLVLVIDQLEEVFTTCEDHHERQTFLDALSAAANGSALVVLGLRADFYARCAAEPTLVKALQHSKLVTPMNTDELRDAIEKPAHKAGLRLEADLTRRILHGLGTSNTTGPSSGLPLLSYALFETWRRRQGKLLTLAGYEATGGIWQAVAQAADNCYNNLSEPQQQVAQAMLSRMVHLGQAGADDTRRQVRRSDLPDTGDAEQVLHTFATARLISLGTDTVEITHEALLRAWPTLRGWIDTDRTGNLIRQHLEDDATTWTNNGRDRALLYRGNPLRIAHDWAATPTHRDQLSSTALRFLAASTRLRRVFLAALTVLGMLIVAAAGFAFQQAAVARQQATVAQHERDRAVVNQLIVQADQVAATDVSLSAQLYLAAHDLQPDNPDVDTALINKPTHPYPRRAVYRHVLGCEVVWEPTECAVIGEPAPPPSPGKTLVRSSATTSCRTRPNEIYPTLESDPCAACHDRPSPPEITADKPADSAEPNRRPA